MINNIRKLINSEKFNDFLENKVKPIFIRTITNSGNPETYYHIETDGKNIWITNLLRLGSQSISSIKGETIILYLLSDFNDIKNDWFNINLLTKKQQEEMAEYLEEPLENILNKTNYGIESVCENLFIKEYNKQLKLVLEEEWDIMKKEIIQSAKDILDDIERISH